MQADKQAVGGPGGRDGRDGRDGDIVVVAMWRREASGEQAVVSGRGSIDDDGSHGDGHYRRRQHCQRQRQRQRQLADTSVS